MAEERTSAPAVEPQSRMPRMPWGRRRYQLFGEIARLSFTATDHHDDGPRDHLWHIAESVRTELEGEMNRVTRATLGPSFELQEVQFEHGSLHIHAVLVAIEAVYVTVAHYHHFNKSIDLLVRQLRSIIGRVLGRQHPSRIEVVAVWVPTPMLAAPESEDDEAGPYSLQRLVVGYLILSHAALIAVLVWLIVTHLR